MLDFEKRFRRTLALNTAADSLGYDPTTSQAMVHIETMVTVLHMSNLTWADVPERCSYEWTLHDKLGESALMGLRASDGGLDLVIQSEHDEDIRARLLGAYVQCIEIVGPAETTGPGHTN